MCLLKQFWLGSEVGLGSIYEEVSCDEFIEEALYDLGALCG